jgi:hypothetical protein
LSGASARAGVLGRFPWQPFPPGEPDPGGSDPLLASIYRAAVEGGDAYRATRAALRREGEVLRVGNRFVPEGRYREVGFVALGHAAASMALAVLDVFGDRVTQGFVAGPEKPPDDVPFLSVQIGHGWGGSEAVPEVLEASRSIAGGLRPNDLFLLLLSPGALRALLLPPPGVAPTEFAELLAQLSAQGVSGREIAGVARVFGTGGVGGALLPGPIVADQQCLIVDRGDGARAVGGGPMFPVSDPERLEARATLERAGRSLAASAREAPLPASAAAGTPRPVVVAAPEDALGVAADVVVDKGWVARSGILGLREPPGPAALRLLERTDAILAAERPGADRRWKGIAVFATATLDLPEGVDTQPACEAFLASALRANRRREVSVGLLRTAGPSGAVVGAPGDPTAKVPADRARALPMRAGITDVGEIAVALVPLPPGTRASRRPSEDDD